MPQTVSITCSDGAAIIRYTTNGLDPNESSTQYSAPFAVSTTTTVNAKAFKTGTDPSTTASAVITLVWESRTNMPIALNNSGSCAIGGKMYIFGGYTGAAYSSAVYEFDPASGTLGTWRAMASLPATLSNMSVIANSDVAYVIGGYNGTDTVATVYTFDPDSGATGTWATKTSIPGKRWGAGAALSGGYIYIFGGGDGVIFPVTCYRYSISTDAWITLPSTSNIPRSFGLANVGAATDSSGRIYCMGGYDSEYQYSSATYRYDPSDATPSWIARASIPSTVIADMAFASYGDGFFLFGGNAKTAALDTVYYYSFTSNSYELHTNGFTARMGSMAAITGSAVYFCGGRPFSSSAPYLSNYVYFPGNDF